MSATINVGLLGAGWFGRAAHLANLVRLEGIRVVAASSRSAESREQARAIVGDELQVEDGSLLDHDTSPMHNVTIRTTDDGGLFCEETFTITVTAGNMLTGFDVQQGATQRSYVRYVSVLRLGRRA